MFNFADLTLRNTRDIFIRVRTHKAQQLQARVVADAPSRSFPHVILEHVVEQFQADIFESRRQVWPLIHEEHVELERKSDVAVAALEAMSLFHPS